LRQERDYLESNEESGKVQKWARSTQKTYLIDILTPANYLFSPAADAMRPNMQSGVEIKP